MTNQETQITGSKWRLPFGFFAGPILWAIQIIVGYGLVTVSCSIGNKLPVYVTVGISALIVLAAAFVAYGAWRSIVDASIWMEANESQDATRFLIVSGFLVSLLFFLLILATFVAAFFLSPCPLISMPLP